MIGPGEVDPDWAIVRQRSVAGREDVDLVPELAQPVRDRLGVPADPAFTGQPGVVRREKRFAWVHYVG